MILDSYAVIALLRDEPAAAQVQQLLADNADALLTVVGLIEVIDRLVRLAAVDPEDAVLDLAQLGLSEPVPLDPDVALRAGLLRARHYHRRNRAVSLADCVAAETARRAGQAVVTSDPHLLDMCEEEAITVVVLPDSRGDVWTTTR